MIVLSYYSYATRYAFWHHSPRATTFCTFALLHFWILKVARKDYLRSDRYLTLALIPRVIWAHTRPGRTTPPPPTHRCINYRSYYFGVHCLPPTYLATLRIIQYIILALALFTFPYLTGSLRLKDPKGGILAFKLACFRSAPHPLP